MRRRELSYDADAVDQQFIESELNEEGKGEGVSQNLHRSC
jgi:hypothetical protein